MNLNITHSEWMNWSGSKKREYTAELQNSLKDRFELATERHAADLPVFEHRANKLKFRLIPGGEFIFGFTNEHEIKARKIFDPPPITLSEVRPFQKIHVNAFLMGLTPLLWNTAQQILSDLSRPSYRTGFSAAFLEKKFCEHIARELDCRLPTEVEWEYACRANSNTLFPWGDSLPDTQVLKEWLNLDFSQLDKLRGNSFGLYGMFTGEWCLDEYRESHSLNAKSCPGAYVIKGGGAIFWPWQGQEWVWCIPAMRMPSTDLINNTCGCRFVYPISAA